MWPVHTALTCSKATVSPHLEKHVKYPPVFPLQKQKDDNWHTLWNCKTAAAGCQVVLTTLFSSQSFWQFSLKSFFRNKTPPQRVTKTPNIQFSLLSVAEHCRAIQTSRGDKKLKIIVTEYPVFIKSGESTAMYQVIYFWSHVSRCTKTYLRRSGYKINSSVDEVLTQNLSRQSARLFLQGTYVSSVAALVFMLSSRNAAQWKDGNCVVCHFNGKSYFIHFFVIVGAKKTTTTTTRVKRNQQFSYCSSGNTGAITTSSECVVDDLSRHPSEIPDASVTGFNWTGIRHK